MVILQTRHPLRVMGSKITRGSWQFSCQLVLKKYIVLLSIAYVGRTDKRF